MWSFLHIVRWLTDSNLLTAPTDSTITVRTTCNNAVIYIININRLRSREKIH